MWGLSPYLCAMGHGELSPYKSHDCYAHVGSNSEPIVHKSPIQTIMLL
jgi:hypothetical protein